MTLRNNKTKTYLVVGLSLAVILVSSSIGVTSINAYALSVLSTSNTGTINNKIPDDKILKRNWSDWKGQYTEDEFYALENNTKSYMDSIKSNPSLSNNLNKAIVRDLTVIHNFHTMIVKKDYGQEILAVVVSKQRLNHAYTADEPVKRFHDWIISKYAVPSTISEIDKKLKDMEYEKYAPLTNQVIDAYNDAAKNGVVPSELFAQDPSYWGNVSFQSFCQSDSNCSFGKTSDNTKTANTNFSGNIIDDVYILVSHLGKMLEPQSAYAVTTTHYNTYFFYQVTPSGGCIDGLSCPITASTSGIGPVTIPHWDSNGKHGVGTTVSIYSVAYDKNNYQSTHNVKLNVTVDGYNVYTNCVASKTGTGYISITQTCTTANSPNATWTFFIDGTADVWSTS